MNQDQQEIVNSLVFIAAQWLEPVPVDCQDLDPLPERLGGLVFSLFPELEGAGNLPQMRLSPKGQPSVNLVDHYMHDQWPNVDDADDPQVRTFLTAVAEVLHRHQREASDPREAMGSLLVDLCRVIEGGYELVPLFFDDDGDFESAGEDVAPGLSANVGAAWAGAEVTA